MVQAPQLNTACWFFDLQAKASRETMRDFLDVPQALGMISEQQKQQMLSGKDDFGRSIFYAESNYDDSLATALFLDQSGQPRGEDQYDKLGREALRCLIHPQDPDQFRLLPLQDNSLWSRMKEAGQAALSTVLPRPIVDAGLLVLLAVLTGGLHLDGFMDTCDGLFSMRPPACSCRARSLPPALGP